MIKKTFKTVAALILALALFAGCENPSNNSTNNSANNSTNNPSEDPANSNVEQTLKNAIQNVKKVPATKEEFTALISEVMAEFSGASATAKKVTPSGTPITNADEIVTKLKELIPDAKNFAQALNEGKNATFKKSINIGEMSYENWLKVVFDFYDELNKEFNNSSSPSSELKKQMIESLNMTEEDFNKLLENANKYSSIKQFYVNADISKTASDISAKAQALVSAGVSDVDKVIGLFYPEKPFTSPIKVAFADVSYDCDVGLAENDFNALSNRKFDQLSENAKIGYEFYTSLKFAVCTKSGNGGIVKIETTVNRNKNYFIKLEEINKKIQENTITQEECQKELIDLLKEYYKIKISVEDKDGNSNSIDFTIEDLYGFGSAL